MTAAASLAFPGNRILGGWWRQLAEHRPETLWVGHLLLHHVQALVGRTVMRRPAVLDLHVLKAAALQPGGTLAELDRRLHLGPQLTRQVLRQLASGGLIQERGGWTVTELGTQALAGREVGQQERERRSFYFLAGETPQFLPLRPLANVPWEAGDDWQFALPRLTALLAESVDGKRRSGFPLDAEPVGAADAEPAWRRVVLDRPERLLVALIPKADRLTGFAARQDGWTLLTAEPTLELADCWPEVFPTVAAAPNPAEVREAWQGWCQAHGCGELAAEVSDLRLDGHYLHVSPSPRLLERLRAGRSEALREEFWALVGSGRLRRAAIVKVGEAR